MKEFVLTLLNHSIADSQIGTRKELCMLCTHVLITRIPMMNDALNDVDIQLLSMLLMECKDESSEVCEVAKQVK